MLCERFYADENPDNHLINRDYRDFLVGWGEANIGGLHKTNYTISDSSSQTS